ncbi:MULTISPECIES: DUF2171 domain-containing protein [Acinetobacter]|uniref:DUF2171 domain-containing protein n=2 Tax=Acinetobacter TaxID=469 RepID=A0A1Z9YVV5_9GAMM|nr:MULTISPECIES: DUF2171 domain-containing protein [Acinetobacter]MCH4248643.1 DUF2171 domain-containing protein [Acinetobacter populi]OUY06340.1 hypothetical protein CAP51_13875 [Acinetobacter populi]SNX46365.1 hypothetical protein SAMN05421731_11114 [Acinetobacter puyangensis]
MATLDPNSIQEHAEVLGSDHEHVGRVDHLEGQDQVKLIKNDEDADGQHHYIPTSWIQDIQNDKVILNISASEAQQRWQTQAQ